MYQFKTTSVLVMVCCERIPVTRESERTIQSSTPKAKIPGKLKEFLEDVIVKFFLVD